MADETKIKMTDAELAEEREIAINNMQWADLEYANSSSSFAVQRAIKCTARVAAIEDEISRRKEER